MTTIWTNRLAHQLREHDLISRVTVHVRRLVVQFLDGTRERFSYHRRHQHWLLTRANTKFRYEPSLVRQYEPDLIDDDSSNYAHHLVVPRLRYSLIERLVVGHRLITAMTNHGYDGQQAPRIVQSDWINVKQIDVDDYRIGNAVTFRPRMNRRIPGRYIQHHFFDLGGPHPIASNRRTLPDAFNDARFMSVIMRKLVRKKRGMGTDNMTRMALKYAGPVLWPPGSYMAILSAMRSAITAPVLDLNPGLGHKALACAALGLPYRAAPCQLFEAACRRGFSDYVGLRLDNTTERPSVVLADNDFRATWPGQPSILDRIGSLLRQHVGSIIVAMVPISDRQAVASTYPPRLQLKLHLHIGRNVSAYLFIW